MTALEMTNARGTRMAGYISSDEEMGTFGVYAAVAVGQIEIAMAGDMPRTRGLSMLFGLLTCLFIVAAIIMTSLNLDVLAYASMLTAAGSAAVGLTMVARLVTEGRF